MRATQQFKYALYGIFDLAFYGGRDPVSLQEIGARQGIPSRYLEQIFQRLRRAGLVSSKRGPGGGYLLAAPPHQISVADVIVAVQGALLSMGNTGVEGGSATPGFVWNVISEDLQRTLAGHAIADICRQAEERGLRRADGSRFMYEI